MSNTTAEIKQNVRRFFEEVFPRNDDDGVTELVHPDVFDHSSPPGAPQGIEDVKRTMRWLNSVFSDMRWEIHQIIAEGDTAAV
ncbi:MAG: ester cyclase [Acidimicrobiia bacterium]